MNSSKLEEMQPFNTFTRHPWAEINSQARSSAAAGTVKSSNRDLQENVLSSGTAFLEGRRIQVQSFN